VKIVVFQPFQRVWTPRTPDSNYDSLGPPAPLKPIVFAPLLAAGIGLGISLASGAYKVTKVLRGSVEGAGSRITFLSGTYTAPPP
jgi:hypothetical protein